VGSLSICMRGELEAAAMTPVVLRLRLRLEELMVLMLKLNMLIWSS